MRRITYARAAEAVTQWSLALTAAGYAPGQRVAVSLGNRPEHLVLKLALNAVGLSVVPINPDLRPAELAFQLTDSAAVLAVTDAAHVDHLRAGLAEAGRALPVVLLDGLADALPPAPEAPRAALTPQSESCLLYTSGTTGRPKGCILSHENELMIGARYLSVGGLMTIRPGERLMNPLPLYHINAATVSFMAMMLSGGVPDPAAALLAQPVVAGCARHRGGRAAHAGHRGPGADGRAARSARPRPWRAARGQRRGRSQPAPPVRAPLRPGAGGDLGHDRDVPHPGCRA
ncbi:MAG: hypothetical protein KatS3mg118_1629 [Paracoccaceae bacterium]|nr:MAG: hypothetical protein KatS3mg118_1629 [Paracoccaceae bacterium]